MMKQTHALLLGAAAVVFSTASAHAQLPVSRTIGIQSTDLTANKFKFVSVPFKKEPIARGPVTSVSGSTLGLSIISGTSSLSGLPEGYVAQIISGSSQGATFEVIEALTTGTTLVVSGTPSVEVGLDQIEVVQKLTLIEAFPNGGGFKGAPTSGDADKIIVVNPSNSLEQLFYDTDASPVGWRSVFTAVNANGYFLPLNSGVLAQGAPTAPGVAIKSGVVASGDQRVQLPANLTRFVSNPYDTNLTLADLESGIKSAATAGDADKVVILNPGLQQVFFNGTDWLTVFGAVIVSNTTSVGEAALTIGAPTAPGNFVFTQPFVE